jgi:hypothetical protein
MASKRKEDTGPTKTRRRAPATTPEARELQLTMLAYDEAERLIRAGEASSQVLTHFLKVGSTREEKEKRRLELEADLTAKKIEAIDSAKNIERLYDEAIKSMRRYGGQEPIEIIEE